MVDLFPNQALFIEAANREVKSFTRTRAPVCIDRIGIGYDVGRDADQGIGLPEVKRGKLSRMSVKLQKRCFTLPD